LQLNQIIGYNHSVVASNARQSLFFVNKPTSVVKPYFRHHGLPRRYAPRNDGKKGRSHTTLALHAFFIPNSRKLLSSATLSYTSYLCHVCSNEPVEVGVAAVLPCFWIYREVGLFIAKQSKKINTYACWIETYASEDFSVVVDEAIDIFDVLAQKTANEIRNKMIDAFYKSSCLEWHFWNDSYDKWLYIDVFDDCSLNKTK